MLTRSNTLKKVKPSATIAVSTKAAELKRAGKDVIGLAAGEPDFDTPEHIADAACKAIRDGKTRYTPTAGIVELREAIAAKFARDNGFEPSVDAITVGCGGKQVIYNALVATLNPGDEVIIPAPYWVSYVDMVVLGGGVPVVVECPATDGFLLTPARLEAAISPKTKWLMLNSPSNPTGAAYSGAQMDGLADVIRKHPQIGVMTDEIYEHLVYDGFVAESFRTRAPDLADRTIVINGLSKAYCMTGWRVGYATGPSELIKAMNVLQSQSTSMTASVSQWAGVAALNGPQDFIAHNNTRFVARRDAVAKAMNAIDGISCAIPQGAFYVYPAVDGLIGKRTPAGTTITSDEDLALYMLDSVGVAVVFGAAFGTSPAFRISYAAADDVLAEACSRIAQSVSVLT